MKYEFIHPKGSRVITLTDSMFQRFADDPYRLANMIRKGMGRKPIREGQGQDGKDVAGVGKNSPCQLIWVGNGFKAVSYDAALARPGAVRSGLGGTKKQRFFLDLRSAMDNYRVVVGKREKGADAQYESRPIAQYNKQVDALIEGKINKHSADQLRFKKTRPFIINTTGVDIPESAVADLTLYGEMFNVKIDWVASSVSSTVG